ncbi:hypothetical protein B0O80DRAFT_457103 [Mortierella sp. GBAus27b]|nr:hypothetical protein B0O80DRAFT_457103 [Mortierella sp. GBAus27b]
MRRASLLSGSTFSIRQDLLNQEGICSLFLCGSILAFKLKHWYSLAFIPYFILESSTQSSKAGQTVPPFKISSGIIILAFFIWLSHMLRLLQDYNATRSQFLFFLSQHHGFSRKASR